MMTDERGNVSGFSTRQSPGTELPASAPTGAIERPPAGCLPRLMLSRLQCNGVKRVAVQLIRGGESRRFFCQ
jgi:hypothetical protein